MERARFLSATYSKNPFDKHSWEHTDLTYEYRGHQYIVTKHNNGYSGDPLWLQHKNAQAEIDYKIEHENDPIPDWSYEGSAQEGFDLFWNYVEGNIDEASF